MAKVHKTAYIYSAANYKRGSSIPFKEIDYGLTDKPDGMIVDEMKKWISSGIDIIDPESRFTQKIPDPFVVVISVEAGFEDLAKQRMKGESIEATVENLLESEEA